MLTPRELLQTDFRIGLRGYNQKEVDAFIRKIVASYETLTRQNKELTEQLQKAEEALSSLRTEGEKSSELLTEAQKNAIEIKTRAEEEATKLLQEAAEQAEQILAEAREAERAALARVERIRNEERAVRRAWREMLEAALFRLDEEEPEGERSTSFRGEPNVDHLEAAPADEAAAALDVHREEHGSDSSESFGTDEP